MSGMGGGKGRNGRIVAAVVVTVGVGVGLFALKAAGLFSQIGPMPTRLLIGADLFVVGLMWYRVIAR